MSGEKRPYHPRKDLSGQRFGRLTVIKPTTAVKYKNGTHGQYLCLCDCGKTVEVLQCQLATQKTISCGCYRKEVTARNKKTHGKSENRLYNIWCAMKQRCYYPKNKAFRSYGGRGIQVCEAWKNDFTAFEAWAIKNGYTDKLTIDRINPNGNYEPCNCRWIPQEEQSKNRRPANEWGK